MASSPASSVDADGEIDDSLGMSEENGLPIDPSLFAPVVSGPLQESGGDVREADPASQRSESTHHSQMDPTEAYEESIQASTTRFDPYPGLSQTELDPEQPGTYEDPTPYGHPSDNGEAPLESYNHYEPAYAMDDFPSGIEEPIAGPSRLPEESPEPPRKRRRTASSIASSSLPSISHYPSLDTASPNPNPPERARGKPGRKPKQPSDTSSSHNNNPTPYPPTTAPRPKAKSKPIPGSAFAIGNNQFLVSANGKPPRETECSFCLGTDERNKEGVGEWMLSCTKCGRSGHPSCLSMDSASLRAKVRTYAWECIECKVCEICESKGEDNRLMFCDGCDRGWHSYCLNPPLSKPPKGVWKCPGCVSSHDSSNHKHKSSDRASTPANSTPTTSKIVLHAQPNGRSYKNGFADTPVTGNKQKGKGKGKERAFEYDDEVISTPGGFRGKSTPKGAFGTGGVGSKATQVIKLRIPVPHIEPPPTISKRRGRPPKALKMQEAELDETEEEQVFEREPTPLPFGGIIEGADADITATSISAADKAAFEKSRQAADLVLGSNIPDNEDGDLARGREATPETASFDPSYRPEASGSGSAFRPLRDRLLLQNTASSGLSQTNTPGSSTRPNLPPSTLSTGLPQTVSEKIRRIRFGQFDIDTWYAAPYPEEYARVPDGRLWICEFCLKYMKSGFVAGRHQLKCKTRHPPGDEIYREGAVSVFEVDGRKNKIYCQNLCLIAKMFLDHKTLYYDVEPFLFYVMTEVDDDGAKFVGYFSKEKRSATNNVSCIMTLPVRQRKGWGNLLIDFSYLLSKKEGRTGSPEKPLSGLGALSYRNYWTSTLFRFLDTAVPPVTLDQISTSTSMMLEDVYTTLQENNMIDVYDSAEEMERRRTEPAGFWPNAGIARQALSRNNLPAERTAVPLHYSIHWDPAVIQAHIDKVASKGWLKLRPEKLKYTPFLVTRVAFGKDGMLVSKSLTQVQADGLPEDRPPTVEQVEAVGLSVEVQEDQIGGVQLPHAPDLDLPVQPAIEESSYVTLGDAARNPLPLEEHIDTAVRNEESPRAPIAEVANEHSHDEDFRLDETKNSSPVKQKSERVREVSMVIASSSPARRMSVRQGVAASLSTNLGRAEVSPRETRGSSRVGKAGFKG